MRKNKSKRIGIVIILIIAMLMFILKPFISDNKQAGSLKSATREIAFRHEGNLMFVNDTSSVITIEIEVADTDPQRARGLMYRKSMPENRGMIFLMDRLEIQNFYMKNTYIPLDIIYVDADKKVVSIQKQTTPLSELTLPSEGPAKFVVEVIGGFCDKYEIKKGTTIQFELF
ncbi:MAG: uncharacterized membrane protein (UPF0127 family) [Flavobacteriales bacterium]|jgi:uncharacterized membrane protein (UPF0127 family)